MIFMFIATAATVKGVCGLLDWTHKLAKAVRKDKMIASHLKEEEAALEKFASQTNVPLATVVAMSPPKIIIDRLHRRLYRNTHEIEAVEKGNGRALRMVENRFERFDHFVETGEAS